MVPIVTYAASHQTSYSVNWTFFTSSGEKITMIDVRTIYLDNEIECQKVYDNVRDEISKSYDLISAITGLNLTPPIIMFNSMSGMVGESGVLAPPRVESTPDEIIIPTVVLKLTFRLAFKKMNYTIHLPNGFTISLKNQGPEWKSYASYNPMNMGYTLFYQEIKHAMRIISDLEGTIFQFSTPIFQDLEGNDIELPE
jgi:hypothetical protein